MSTPSPEHAVVTPVPGQDPTSAHAPRVLVVVASRHGATADIAAALAGSIADSDAGRAAGLSAVHFPADQRPDPSPYDAVVIGSAVYAGRWLEPAREYMTQHADVLRTRQVWLFSSGPIGEPPFPPDEAYDVAVLTSLTGAKGHRTFPGRLDKNRLSFGERAMVTAMRAPVGDFRNWDAVRRWGGEIAGQIAGIGKPTTVGT
jgi:menaquinone-dependent protoporphyrinogen oxidase